MAAINCCQDAAQRGRTLLILQLARSSGHLRRRVDQVDSEAGPRLERERYRENGSWHLTQIGGRDRAHDEERVVGAALSFV
jgi:hypothetical protein